MEAHFIVNQENGTPKKFRLAESEYVILGRNADKCQVQLSDDLCSGTHCKISIQENAVFVEDMNSKNGVYLNGTRVLKQRIYINDKVKFGQTTVYLNPQRMDKDSINICTFDGNTEKRDLGHVTMELFESTSIEARSASSYTRTKKSRKEANTLMLQAKKRSSKLSRQKSAATPISNPMKPMSRAKLNALKYIANIIDLTVLLLCFILIMEIVKNNDSVIHDLSLKGHYLKFLLKSKVLPYTIASFLASTLIYRLNRGLPNGSIGDRVMKINDTSYK